MADGGEARRTRWQVVTVAVLFAGYTGYYFCRSNLPVCLLLIEDELAAGGMTRASAREGMGWAVTYGTLGYALGKFLSGSVADAVGGRRNVLIGMAGSVACTLAFAAGGGLPMFTLAWSVNRVFQSLGWVGIVKVSSRWFSYAAYGTVMGVLSLSFQFGDAASRNVMGQLIRHEVGWRGVFVASAGLLFGLFVLTAWLLRESPDLLGLAEPPANPANVYGAAGESPTPPGVRALVVPLLTSPGFLLVCLLSVGLTLLREAFNTWTPTYFVEGLGLTKAEAAGRSALFPLLGGVSVLAAGLLSDRLGRAGRAAIIAVGLFLAGGTLLTLGLTDFGGSRAAPIALVSAVAFLLVGPYSFLAGAVALDFGGKRGSATASGLIDGFGYLGGMLAGAGVAKVSLRYGWQGAFLGLAGVAFLTGLVAAAFLVHQRRADRAVELPTTS